MTNLAYLPSNTTSERIEEITEIRFVTPYNYPFLEGHFPNNPIVPAIAQIGWCLDAITKDLGSPPARYQISRFKFTSPILPEKPVCLRFTRKESRYIFAILLSEKSVSSGTISLGDWSP